MRTRTRVKPVFVSVGSGISLDRACAHTLRLTPRYRIPRRRATRINSVEGFCADRGEDRSGPDTHSATAYRVGDTNLVSSAAVKQTVP